MVKSKLRGQKTLITYAAIVGVILSTHVATSVGKSFRYTMGSALAALLLIEVIYWVMVYLDEKRYKGR